MNDKQILTLILKTHAIRAVQIADALDAELVDVSNAMKSLVEVGDVVRTAGTAPNGQPAQFYSLSEEFRKSRECAKLQAEIDAQNGSTAAPAPTEAPVATPAATPTPAPTAAPEPTPTPTPTRTPAPAAASAPTSKVARAIEYITEHGRASGNDLRTVMGLKAIEAPTAYLKCALQDGRVRRDGEYFVLGNKSVKPPPTGRMTPQPHPSATNTPTSLESRSQATTATTLAIPTFSVGTSAAAPRPAQTAAPVAIDAASADFRCGLWIGDVVELQRGTATFGSLARHEAVLLRDFLNRVLPAEASA